MKQLIITSFIIIFFISSTIAQKTKKLIKPNIIIFYADDLGWQDTQLNDLDTPSPWETPNIRSLAKDGLNFTNAYSPAPTCAPSRCSIMTGLHPTKTGVTHVAGGTIPSSKKYSTLISPFYPLGLKPEHTTIAEVLKKNGYKTGHSGKWHMGDLKTQKPTSQGFDFSYERRGAHQGTKGKKNRLNSFATSNSNDTYQLSEEKYPPYTKNHPNGISYPKDAVTEEAISFIDKNKNEPFFLYLAHWMVHYPIHTRNKELLKYYCDKLEIDFPKDPGYVTTPGQTNPYYGAMVSTLDWSLGRVINFLKTTRDPRNPDKNLYETTYIIFSSDNGGCERHSKEIITDNFPLNQGKKYAQEGGVRVPTIIYGPNVVKGKNHNGLMNQLDLFPTILDLTQSSTTKIITENLDGLNITNILEDSNKKALDKKGNPREFLWWHFPHNTNSQMQSAIRSDDFKLYKNHATNDYSLYRLYNNGKRLDIEEKFNVINKPENKLIIKKLSKNLEEKLTKHNAKYPYKNPFEKRAYLGKEKAIAVPKIMKNDYNSQTREATITVEKRKSKIAFGYALIKISDTSKKAKSTYIKIPIKSDKKATIFKAIIPKEAQEYLFILIDENQFIIKSSLTKSQYKKTRPN